MKKLWTQERYRRYQARRQKRAMQRRATRRGRHGRGSRPPSHPIERTILIAPNVFSLLRAPNETLEFLRDLRQKVPIRNSRIEIDLKHVESIDPEAVATMVAIMQSPNAQAISVSGNVPDDPECLRRLHDFGFFDCVTGGPSPSQSPGGRIRMEMSGKLVRAEIARDIMAFGMEKLGTPELKHKPTFTVFTEAMANTVQHAAGSHDPEPSWWAAAYYDGDKGAVCFTSVDLGVGILKSLKFRLRRRRFQRLFGVGLGEGKKLKMLLDGEVESRTGEQHRGRGLPKMREACEDGRIRNLVVLSNKAFAQVATESHLNLKCGFRGTIIYWEVHGAALQES